MARGPGPMGGLFRHREVRNVSHMADSERQVRGSTRAQRASSRGLWLDTEWPECLEGRFELGSGRRKARSRVGAAIGSVHHPRLVSKYRTAVATGAQS